MAWRITVTGFPKRIRTAHQAVAYLKEILSKDKVTSQIVKDYYDNGKRKMLWETYYPEFCNGIHGFGRDWDQWETWLKMVPGREREDDYRYIMIRFGGHFPEAMDAFNKRKGLYAEIGG